MITDFKKYMKLPKTTRQSHLKLSEDCLERGGNSTIHRGVLAQFLDTIIPMGRIAVMAHACNNGKCSNPRHLYWATDRENLVEDGTKFGTWKNTHQRMVDKYGEEGVRKIRSEVAKGNKGGAGNKGKPKSKQHCENISKARRRYVEKQKASASQSDSNT